MVYYAIVVFVCWNMFCVKLQHYFVWVPYVILGLLIVFYVRKEYGKYIVLRRTSNNHEIIANISTCAEAVWRWI